VSLAGIRSPKEIIGGLVYFGRMLDKIRANERGELPAEYRPNLGAGFDGECCDFVGVNYDAVVAQVRKGGSDEEILAWCRETGRPRTERDIFVWNEFMRKRGWSDEVSPTLERRKKEGGMAGRSEVRTMFQFIDADEGRTVQP
jgi:hypothetical protein